MDPIRLDARFQRGVELFNAASWYEAHDVLEELWHETADPDRRVLQGLIQVAVAHVHLERGNRKGATILDQLRSRVSVRLQALQQDEDPASCPVPVLLDLP